MNNHPLAGLEPACVLRYFEEICAIPHGSTNTRPISDYLVSVAQSLGLRYRQDEANNVIIWKDGTPGYEDHAPVILQGHMDMVCEKDADCPINFETDGLDLTHDGTHMFARGTTLGGDDGIAVAYGLALLASKDIPHPPLEVVITVDEEIGMLGAAAIDLSDVKGRMLLNIDSEDEGVFTVSCAGGATSTVRLPVRRNVVTGPCVLLEVGGLQGGHSGAEIHKNRGNANKIMGQLLARLQEQMPLCLVSFSGGSKDNAIPRTCRANVVAMGLEMEKLQTAAAALQEEGRAMYNDPELTVCVTEVEAMGGLAMSTADTRNFIGLVNALPNGIQAMSQHIEGLVQTSLNMGIARLEQDEIIMTFSVRSSVNQEKEELIAKLRQVAQMFGASYSQMGEYPAWEYREESTLRDVCVAAYRELYGAEPRVEAIHAGLECGLLGDKLPGLDCVSFGPQMQDIHTSREKLHIASTERTWKFLLEVLKRL